MAWVSDTFDMIEGNGTSDLWVIEDGAHPTAEAHVTVARVAFRACARAKLNA